jgi:RNA polymerase sigma factor (sigma-70 family)
VDTNELSSSQPCGGAPRAANEQPAKQTTPAQDAASSSSTDSREDDALAASDSALAELIAARRAPMLRRAQYELGPEGTTVGQTGTSAEDAVQEASINLLKQHRKPDGRSADSMKHGYDTRTTQNAAIDLRRAWTRELQGKTVVGSDTTDDAAMAKDRHNQEEAARDDADVLAAVPQHLSCLKPDELWVLRVLFEGHTQKEIARQVDRSASWVSTTMSTTIRALGRRLYRCIEQGECPRRKEP